MPKLSIIIVSFNCKTVLSLCLSSIKGLVNELSLEVLVVDNASSDGTPEMVATHFGFCELIENSKNLGFSKANNLGIQKAKSEKILLLNPDTIVFKGALEKSMMVLEENKSIGGVGIRMLDSRGNFLPESKRGIPYPWRAFTKASGLWKISPKSSFWSGYYAGGLTPEQSGEVEILSGAYLMFDKGKLGNDFFLDETFFMFGEDIDFSYRILKKGFQNFYLGSEFIIHFKGESSNKKDPAYQRNFYGAMDLFRKKHFEDSFFSPVLKVGVKILQGLKSRNTKPKSPGRIGKIDWADPEIEMFGKGIKLETKSNNTAIAFNPESPEFKSDLEKSFSKGYDVALFWSKITSSFFLSGGSNEKGEVIPV